MAKKGSRQNVRRESAPESKLKRYWFFKHLILSGISVIILLTAIMVALQYITRHNQELEVPSFINMSVGEALEVANAHHLRLEVTDSVFINRMAPGAIFRQNPEAGGKVKKNRRILLTINAMNPKMIKMPDLVGYSLRQAQSELTANQLSLGKLIYEEDIASNNVLGQIYRGRAIEPGKKIPSESVIDLKVGINDKDSSTYIPELRAIPYRLVREKLAENSLNIKKAVFDESVKDYADSLGAWVYMQDPLPNDTVTVRLGTAVTIYLSKVKEPKFPDKEEEEQEEN